MSTHYRPSSATTQPQHRKPKFQLCCIQLTAVQSKPSKDFAEKISSRPNKNSFLIFHSNNRERQYPSHPSPFIHLDILTVKESFPICFLLLIKNFKHKASSRKRSSLPLLIFFFLSSPLPSLTYLAGYKFPTHRHVEKFFSYRLILPFSIWDPSPRHCTVINQYPAGFKMHYVRSLYLTLCSVVKSRLY